MLFKEIVALLPIISFGSLLYFLVGSSNDVGAIWSLIAFIVSGFLFGTFHD